MNAAVAWHPHVVDIPARSWLGRQIRTRVIGDDDLAHARRARLLEAGTGWFAADAPIRAVHGDASMFVGGLRALLLQSMHPLAMAGVADHSDYRTDPWGRLQRTADFIAATTFGTETDADEAIATVRRVHRRVTGTTADGRRYAANDPHLLHWVHVAETDSFLAAHDRYGVEPLRDDQRDRYVAETAEVARRLGVVDPPTTVRQLDEHLRAFRPELSATPAARDAARYLLVQPPMPLPARPAYALLAGAAVALMPWWTRWPLRLPLLPLTEAVAVRPAGALVTRTIRWALPA
jgi:uncharacterized protein (DUF2236 family)